MKTVGLPISRKPNEKRRCLIPSDIKNIKNKSQVYIETGYGEVLGYSDSEYKKMGINIEDLSSILEKDIICDPKIGDAEYLNKLKCQVVFGWVHAVQNKGITDILIKNKISAYAWEDMFEDGRHIFSRNNEIAGEAAIMHAFTLYGLFPYNIKAAIIGKGNIGRGALKILTMLGADVTVYDRKTEKLFQKEMGAYDVIVNCVLWDTTRKDHIVYEKDLSRLKKGSLIIDISCDRHGAIETCIPTTMDNPTYIKNGIIHYAVDHTPSIFYKSVSKSLSEIVSSFIDELIEETLGKVLKNSLIIDKGTIIDDRIIQFQNR